MLALKISHKHIRSFTFLFLLPFIFHNTLHGQKKLFQRFEPDTTKKVNFIAIPIVIRTPETSWAFGASATATFNTSFRSDSLTRTSNIQLHGLYSLRNQNIQGLDATVYFPKEKYILQFNSSHSFFPDRFWGIGQGSQDSDMEEYSFNQLSFLPHVKRKVKNGFFIGLLSEYQALLNLEYSPGGKFDSLAIDGKSPYHIFGLGLSVSYDTRNAAFWPTKGLYFQSYFLDYDNHIGSNFNFQKWVTDIRYFKRVYKNHVLAFQGYNYSTFGDTPFRSLGMLGGSDNLRGFYQGRYTDKSFFSGILEYRAPIWSRFSACAFIGGGEVYHDLTSIKLSAMHFSFGGGIRFAVNKKERLNMRIDYGYSNRYNHGFYFTIAEAF